MTPPAADEPVDAHTTPPAARWLVLVFLGLAFVYFGGCYRYALGESIPTWAYPGQWSMFTKRESWHHDVIAAAEVDGKPVEVDLLALFPSTWDSGPRYVRGPFRNNPARMRVLAYSICQRMEPKPQRVVVGETRWKARIGVSPSVRANEEKKVTLEFDCGDTVPLPGGVRL